MKTRIGSSYSLVAILAGVSLGAVAIAHSPMPSNAARVHAAATSLAFSLNDKATVKTGQFVYMTATGNDLTAVSLSGPGSVSSCVFSAAPSARVGVYFSTTGKKTGDYTFTGSATDGTGKATSRTITVHYAK